MWARNLRRRLNANQNKSKTESRACSGGRVGAGVPRNGERGLERDRVQSTRGVQSTQRRGGTPRGGYINRGDFYHGGVTPPRDLVVEARLFQQDYVQ